MTDGNEAARSSFMEPPSPPHQPERHSRSASYLTPLGRQRAAFGFATPTPLNTRPTPMRAHFLRRVTLLLLLAPLAGCDTGGSVGPDATSLVGHYTLIQYGGAPLPSGGVTEGELRFEINQTIPVYAAEWTANGSHVSRSGLYSVSGSALNFTETSGSAAVSYPGAVVGNRVTISVNDGTFTTFTFERD